MALILWICGGIVSHAVVGMLAMAYGKAHPTVQSAVADAVAKVEKKIGG